MSKQPIQEIRFGLIKGSIWANQTKSGERHNVTVSRLYRNGDVWKESSHFGRDDLPVLAKVVDLASDAARRASPTKRPPRSSPLKSTSASG